MRPRVLISGGIPLAMLFAGFASAQHAQPDGMPAPHKSALYNIEAFGVFRDLMLQGDFTPKVVIGSVMSRLPSTGVGAVSGARGEITIADGKLIISYGKSDAHPTPDAETAALLATGKVKEWQIIRMDSDVAPSAAEVFLAQAAKAHGLDPDKSFPFQLRGTIAPYVMHVNIAPIVAFRVNEGEWQVLKQAARRAGTAIPRLTRELIFQKVGLALGLSRMPRE